VFSFRGQPIRQVSTKAWYQALERAGIQDFRCHDLWHTRASWHVQSGTPLYALQELGGGRVLKRSGITRTFRRNTWHRLPTGWLL
jgi:integrase